MANSCDGNLINRRQPQPINLSDKSAPPGFAAQEMTPSKLQDNPNKQAVLIGAPRAELTTSQGVGTGASQQILPGNNNRCYFLIQNNSAVQAIRVSFGTEATAARGIELPPGAWFESPIAPTNSVNVFGAIGAQFTCVFADEVR